MNANTIATRILEISLKMRNTTPVAAGSDDDGYCYHLRRVAAFVADGAPVQLVLPAFPAKSSNPEKTLGVLPDMGEALALQRLEAVAVEIEEFYAPGAEIVICSDGRVFSDLVAVTDENVTAYGRALAAMIAKLGLKRITTYDLDDLFPGVVDYDATRASLSEKYGEPVEAVRARALADEDARRLYNGIHRFLFEDLVVLHPEMSRTKVREWAGQQAYRVIQRSNAWSNLVAEQFPGAVRLSIHPQPLHSRKIGIQLVPSANMWRTPWHGAVLFDGKQHQLVRRRDAEEMGAVLVQDAAGHSFFSVAAGVTADESEAREGALVH